MKETDFERAIRENTDEYGIINWGNIDIPDLPLKDGKLEITSFDAEGQASTETIEVVSSSDSSAKNERTRRIRKLWRQIHGNNVPCIRWDDGSTTTYRYDPKTDTITSDNGFSVPINEDTDKITTICLRCKIRELESKIADARVQKKISYCASRLRTRVVILHT